MSLPVRKRVFLCVAAALLVLLAVGLCVKPHGVTAYTEGERQLLAENMDTYTLTVVMHEDTGELAVTQEILFTNRTDEVLSELVLRTYANAFETEDHSPAAIEELYDLTYGDAFSPGGILVQGTWWQDAIAESTYADDAKTVLQIATGAIAPGETGTLRLMYVLTVPECAYRFGRTDKVWQLGNCFPMVAVRENGAWRTEEYYPIGDPFVSESACWQVTLALPDDMVPAASCRMEKGKDGLWHGNALCMRDFAMTLSRGYKTAVRTYGDVRVQVMTTGEKGKDALKLSGMVLETLSSLYGPYPYDTLTVAETAFPFGGMEYPGLVFIEDSYLAADDDSLEMLLAHEIAHQWFYALKGSDSFYDPWQDEALSQWASIRYVGARYGADAEARMKYFYVDAPMEEKLTGSVTPGSPVDYFGDYMTYSTVVYGRGAALLYAVDLMTEGKTDAFLRDYVQDAPFQRSTRAQFEQALNDYFSMDMGPLVTDYLDTLMH